MLGGAYRATINLGPPTLTPLGLEGSAEERDDLARANTDARLIRGGMQWRIDR